MTNKGEPAVLSAEDCSTLHAIISNWDSKYVVPRFFWSLMMFAYFNPSFRLSMWLVAWNLALRKSIVVFVHREEEPLWYPLRNAQLYGIIRWAFVGATGCHTFSPNSCLTNKIEDIGVSYCKCPRATLTGLDVSAGSWRRQVSSNLQPWIKLALLQ